MDSERALLSERLEALTTRISSMELHVDRLSASTKMADFDMRRELIGALGPLRVDRDETIRQLAALSDRDERRFSTMEIELRRLDREEQSFWFRRFFTTVGIANAAAFGLFATGTLQANSLTQAALITRSAMAAFASGATLAGAIPLALWLRATLRRGSTWRSLATAAVGSCSILSVVSLGIGVRDWQVALAALATPQAITGRPLSTAAAASPPTSPKASAQSLSRPLQAASGAH